MVASTLSAGALAVVHYNTDDPSGTQADTVTFALLQPIGSGTQIFFTDRSWNGTAFGGAGGGEGTFTYTAGADMPAGSLITISTAQLNAAGINLSDAGETLYVYQGSNANTPTSFLYAVDMADGNTTFNGSLVNTGLVNGVTAVAVGGDNASFADRGHNIQLPDLLQSIGSATNWTTNDNSPQTTLSGNFFAAPDQQIWVTTAGGGSGFIRVNRDGADTTGTQQVTVYQNSPSPPTQLNHPNDIVFDTVHGLYFFADSDTGNRRIIQGRIADLLDPSATPVFTVLWTDQTAGTSGGQVNGLAIDVNHATGQGALYFVNKGNFNRVEYDHDGTSATNQTADTLATLPAGSFANEIALDIANNRAFVLSTASSTEPVEVPAGTPGAQFDPDSGVWYIIGTNVTNNEIWQVGGLDRTDTSTANTTFTRLNFIGGDGGGTDLQDGAGLLQSIDIDPTSGQLYFTSLQINGGVNGEVGGIYRYNLAAGTYETLYSEGNATDYGFEYIDVDPISGRYFVSNVSFDDGTGANTSSILTHSLSSGTPTHFITAGNISASSPQGLIVNNAPTQTSTGNAATTTETAGLGSGASNAVQPIATIDVTDPDTASQVDQLAGAQVRISGNFQSGAGHADTLTINGTTSGTLDFGTQDITYSYNAATGVMTLSGPSTFNNYEAALLLVRYSVSGDNPTNYGTATNRTISWSVSDGLNYSDETSATITVTGVNDAPVNAVPAGQTFNEDVSRTFSTGNGNAISVSDVDANPATQALSVTLSVTQGALTLSGVTGLTFSIGDGTGDATMTFTGTANAINTALNGLVYAPIADYNGSDTLTFTVNDQGLNGTGGALQDSDTVALTITAVADIADDSVTIAEDAGATNILVQANDTFENAAHAITAVGAASHGTVTIHDNGTAGDTTDDYLVYTADTDFNGTDSFTYTVTSGGVTETATVTVTVTAVADIVADSVTVNEDSGANTLDLLGNDSFENSGRAITAVGAASHGTVSINDNGTTLDATDDFVVYTPDANYNGADSFTYTVTSGGVTETATVSVTVSSVNDAPAGADKTVTLLEDGSHTLTAADFGFTDTADGNSLMAVKITTLPGAGTLTLDGVAVIAGDFVIIGDINAGKLVFTPAADANGSGYADFTFQVQDNGGTGNGGIDLDPVANTITFDVTAVNDAPEGADKTLTVAEDGSHVFAAADFGFSDTADGDNLLAVKITTLPGAGTLLLDGAAVNIGDFVSVADIDAGKLVFTPAANANGSGYASFTFQVQDDGTTADGGVDLDGSANTITVDVTAVNDAPVNTVPGAQSVNEDGSLTLSTANSNAISVADVDAGSLTVTLSVGNGALTLASTTGLTFTTGDGTGDATMTFSGTAANINAALGAGLTYAPGANYNGSDSITVLTSDGGATGTGGTLTDSDTVAITVDPLNDAPDVAGGTPTVAATEQTAVLLLPTVTLSDPDLDAYNGGDGDYAGALFVVGQSTPVATDSFGFDTTGASFTVSGNELHVGGLTFAVLTFAPAGALGITFTSAETTATTALVNEVVQHLTYTNTSDAPPATVNLVYGLQDGAPGAGQGTVVGGNDLDGAGIVVNITAVNDAPAIANLDGDNATFTEGGSPVKIDVVPAGDPVVAVSDPDSTNFDGGTLTIAITANEVAGEDVLGFEMSDVVTFSDDLNVGSTVSVSGVAVGTVASGGSGANGDPIVIDLNANASSADIGTVLFGVQYSNTNADDPSTATRGITVTLTDGDGGSTSADTTVTVVGVDDAGTANQDVVFTDEASTVGGDVLANDTDVDSALTLGTVEGSAANIDTQITLASGALLTVNADGTFTYDPNGQFDGLAQFNSGAANAKYVDSFSYTLSDGSAATVNVVVRGLASDPHILLDRSGNDVITGTGGIDIFVADRGGTDILSGGGENDLFYLGNAFASDDQVDGGAGGDDGVWLSGDYSAGLTFLAGTMTNVERLTLGSGFAYWLALDDANVAAGSTFVVNGARLSPTESLTFDGSAETDGVFQLRGGGCDDLLVGGAGGDLLNGATGADLMAGGLGDDSYRVDNVFDFVSENPGEGHDVVRTMIDYALGDDVEDLWLGGLARSGDGNAGNNAIYGSFGDDVLQGLAGDDILRGRSGADQLHGGDDNDILYGGLGNDQLEGGLGHDRLNGEAGIDVINGGDGDDSLYGKAGADILNGGAGSDLLYGGIQADMLTGGTGADLFLFADGETGALSGNADRILDFNRAEGDLIHLRAMDANILAAGNQTFQFIGNGAFTGTAGELRFNVVQGNAFVSGDVNGDSTADFFIRVDGMTQLVLTDFVL